MVATAVRTASRHLQLMLLGFAAPLMFPSAAFDHRLDAYLQATLVVIEPSRIRLQINLTPGIAVAARVLAVIDRDHNGLISAHEGDAYCELLQDNLVVHLDRRQVDVKVTACSLPEPSDLRAGWGIIQAEFAVTARTLAAGVHALHFENHHLPAVSVYLLNATQPQSGLVQIVRQKRNDNQRVGEIEFRITSARGS